MFSTIPKLKKESLAQVFSCEFCEISKNTFFTKHLLNIATEFFPLDLKNQRIRLNKSPDILD